MLRISHLLSSMKTKFPLNPSSQQSKPQSKKFQQQGASAVEYALTIAVIMLLVVGLSSVMSGGLNQFFSKTADCLEGSLHAGGACGNGNSENRSVSGIEQGQRQNNANSPNQGNTNTNNSTNDTNSIESSSVSQQNIPNQERINGNNNLEDPLNPENNTNFARNAVTASSTNEQTSGNTSTPLPQDSNSTTLGTSGINLSDLTANNNRAISIPSEGSAGIGGFCANACNGLASINGSASLPNQTAGNPIHIPTGNKYQFELDLDYPHLGLRLERHYNSQAADRFSGVGYGWRFGHTSKLQDSDALFASTKNNHPLRRFYLEQGDGRQVLFELSDKLSDKGNPIYQAYLRSDGLLEINENQAIWYWPNGKRIHYNNQGLISRIDSLRQPTQYFDYDSNKKLTNIRSSKGGQLQLSWSKNFLKSAIGPDGQALEYQYDKHDNLQSIKHGNKTQRQYHYEDTSHPHHLTGITDQANNRLSNYAYNKQGQAVLSEHSGGVGRVELHYSDGKTTLRNSLGQETVYHWETRQHLLLVTKVKGVGCASCGEGNIEYVYNKDSQLISQTSKHGLTRHYAWDDANRLISIKERGAKEERARELIRYEYPQEQDTESSSRWLLPIKQIRPSTVSGKSVVTQIHYDNTGKVTRLTQDGWRPPVSGKPAKAISRSVDFTWKDQLLQSIDGPRKGVDDTLQFTYDSNGFVAGVLLASGKHIRILSRDALGRPTRLQHNQREPWQLHYNQQNQVTRVIRGDLERDFDYDGEHLVRIADSTGKELFFDYDQAGRRIAWQDGRSRGQRITLNTENQVLKHQQIGLHEESLWFVDFLYDQQGRIAQVSPFEGTQSHFTYDQQHRIAGISERDNENDQTIAQWHYAWNAANWVESVHVSENDSELSPEERANPIQQFAYNPYGSLSGVTDANQSETVLAYDDFGNLVSEYSADSGLHIYDYDKANNLIQRQDALGNITQYTYDAGNQLINIRLGDGKETRFNYSQDQLNQVENLHQSETYQYDSLGRVTQRQISWGATVQKTLKTRYNPQGQISAQTLASGKTLHFDYNQYGEVNQIRLGDTTLLSGANTEEDDAQQRSYQLGNGEQVTRYFSRGLFVGLDVENSEDEDSADSQGSHEQHAKISRRWTYDKRGNLNVGLRNSKEETFQYDARHRLINALTHSGQIEYSYDNNNNLTETALGEASVNYHYLDLSNQLANIHTPQTNHQTALLKHDKAGNLIRSNNTDYQYNAENRLVRIQKSGKTLAEYAYNGWGQRVKKTVYTHHSNGKTAKTTYFLYNGHQLQAEIDATGAVISEYLYYQQQAFAKVTQNGIFYLHNNAQGAPEWMTDEQQEIVWKAHYQPFGEVLIEQQQEALNLRLPGQYHDLESGLYYNHQRYYQPQWGRYITADPVGLQGGMNRYAYTQANPITQIDPLGLNACDINDVRFAQEEEQGWLSWAWDGVKTGASATGSFVWGVGEGAYDLGKGIVILGADVVVVGTPAGDVIDFFVPGTQQAVRDKYSAAAQAVWNDPSLIVDAFIAPIVDDWNNGNRAEAVGRGFFEVASLIVTPAKLGKLGKAGDIAGDVARTGNRIDELGDVGTLANRTDELGDIARLCSFHGDTLVLTKTGYQAISNIRAGQHQVWSKDELSGIMRWQDVQAQYANDYAETVYITIADEQTQQQQTLISNTVHPFFVSIKDYLTKHPQKLSKLNLQSSEGYQYSGAIEDGYWVDASQLKPGYRLLNDNSSWSKVVDVRIEQQTLKAFNLSVAQFETYFVKGSSDASHAVWVHNNCWDNLPNGSTATGTKNAFGQDVFRGPNGESIYRGHDGRYYDAATHPPSAAPNAGTTVSSAASREMTFTRSQLQKKYSSHGDDFGVFGNPNNQTLAQFENAIRQHTADQSTQIIQGTYRNTQQVTHFFNPNTGLNVMRDANGAFLSGWKLGRSQIENIMRSGNLQ